MCLTDRPDPGWSQKAGKGAGDRTYEQNIATIQKRINDTIAKNKELYRIHPPVRDTRPPQTPRPPYAAIPLTKNPLCSADVL